jgi:hypothetical protein
MITAAPQACVGMGYAQKAKELWKVLAAATEILDRMGSIQLCNGDTYTHTHIYIYIYISI